MPWLGGRKSGRVSRLVKRDRSPVKPPVKPSVKLLCEPELSSACAVSTASLLKLGFVCFSIEGLAIAALAICMRENPLAAKLIAAMPIPNVTIRFHIIFGWRLVFLCQYQLFPMDMAQC